MCRGVCGGPAQLHVSMPPPIKWMMKHHDSASILVTVTSHHTSTQGHIEQ